MTTFAVAPAIPTPLESDYTACRDVTRKRARNFYYGLKLTPEPRRSALYAVYAWMRLGDDIADAEEAIETKRERLDAFCARTQSILGGAELASAPGQPDWAAPMWRAFAHCVTAFSLSQQDIQAMMRGLREDLDHNGYETLGALERYCALVASSVGRVCVTIWRLQDGADESAALDLAQKRGLAFQLTNILRDFAEDHERGRVYIPRELFARHNITPDDLLRWRDERSCGALVGELAGRARRLYDASEPLASMIEPACAPTLWAMTRIYSDLLRCIEKKPELVAGRERASVGALHKAGIVVRAVARAKRGPR